MADPADLLALVEAAIEARLSGGAVEETNEGTQRFRMTPLSELFTLRDRLKIEVAGGISFSTVVPMSTRDTCYDG